MDQVESFVGTLVYIYRILIIGYILLSWLPNAKESFIGEWLGKLVEPYLTPFRRVIPPIGGMLDISPIVALLALQFVAMGIIAIIGIFV